MTLNLRNNVIKFLSSNIEKRYTARQIAEWIYKEYPDECEEKKIRSNSINDDTELVQQIVREISSQNAELQTRYTEFKTTEERPRKYYWTSRSDQAEIKLAESTRAKNTPVSKVALPAETKLYPLLSEFLWSEFGIYPKRIDEKKSSNKQGKKGNKWLYPDLVGMEDLTASWHDEVKSVVKEYADNKTRLWSFEVKVLLNRSNLREAFFQAVSNSSWANMGYLVACEIEGSGTMIELRMLSSLHGIGLIKLNPENPAESQILVPARERQDVDWAVSSRLTQENKDFLQFMKLVRQFHLTDDPRRNDWDLPDDLTS